MQIKVKILRKGARLPTRAHPGDAGMDLYIPEAIRLGPGERRSIPLGIAVEIPEGYAGLIWDKSGLSHKYGIKTFGGVIDSTYRGEVHTGVMNLSERPFEFEAGHKIGQILIQKVESPECVEAEELSHTIRGEDGFGSTGR
jgi:dUTP pyrophosphatase